MSTHSAGDRVAHAQYGDGTVSSVNQYHTIIEFDEAGVRKFASTLVQLERCELPLPVKPAPVRRGRRKVTAGESVVAKDGTGQEVSEPETTQPWRRDPRVPEESTKL